MAIFHKKHYEAIAETIAVMMDDREIAEKVMDEFIVMFERDNPKFNRDKFRAACGQTISVRFP